MGARLLLKLQRLPQAEPVEIAAFSVIILFTGRWPCTLHAHASAWHPEETLVLAERLEVAGCQKIAPSPLG